MPSDKETPRNKVRSVIEARELSELPNELEARWRGDGYEEHSTRELADFFNKRILREAITATGSVPLDGELEDLYRLLHDDSVRSSESMQARERLEEYDINVDALQSDFVSHQTMYRYLKDVRQIDTSSPTKSTTELSNATRQAILRLNNRTKKVVTNNVEKLDDRDEFTVGDFDIYVNVQFSCSTCGTTRDITQILDQGGCDCRQN